MSIQLNYHPLDYHGIAYSQFSNSLFIVEANSDYIHVHAAHSLLEARPISRKNLDRLSADDRLYGVWCGEEGSRLYLAVGDDYYNVTSLIACKVNNYYSNH